MMRFEVPRGTRDFLPYETSDASGMPDSFGMPDSSGMIVRNYVERALRASFESFGYQEIQTPTFETFDLFAARSGEEIRESMFTFASDAGRYALRPEMTAPVCRVVASGALQECQPALAAPYKLYYFGPCFRYCKPRRGQYREFIQAGIELMGAADELADAEVIALAVKVFRRLGVQGFRVKIGNVGIFRQLLVGSESELQEWQLEVIHDIDRLIHIQEACDRILEKSEVGQSDQTYLQSESDFLARLQAEIDYSGENRVKHGDNLSAEKLAQLARDTLAFKWNSEFALSTDTGQLLLDLAQLRGSGQQVFPQAAALLQGTNAAQDLEHLSKVCDWLTAFGIADFEVSLGTARNLDFYTGTVFEIDVDFGGTFKQICGGGRYDKLVEDFGGEPTPATGFAFGFDRLVEVFQQSQKRGGTPVFPPHLLAAVDVIVITNAATLRPDAVQVSESLRDAGLRVAVDLSGRGLEAQMEYADKLRAEFQVILDQPGVDANTCKLRRRDSGAGFSEKSELIADVAAEIKRRRVLENKQ